MAQLTVRCLGGLDVRLGERQITGFESLKVKALLTYLVLQRDRSFSREHLAALFWPEKSAEASRRNLRQTIYNLKSILSTDADSKSPILARRDDLRFDPELDCWLDVDAFEASRCQGLAKGSIDPHQLTAAVTLYRGDFLAGFTLKDSPDFELWQLAAQERLRDQAIEAIAALVESYLSRGEFRLGLQYARRLVVLDPLSEEAHRYLMRLHALCGQRSRSLAQYEELCLTLSRELGVEPLEETQELFETILKEQAPPTLEEEEKGIGPLIPLVGRQNSYQKLRVCWQAVLDRGSQMTLVAGEPGIGKTRLIKSFLDATGSQRVITILKGRCSERIPTSYQPFAQVLRNAIAEDAGRALTHMSDEDLESLERLVPDLRERVPDLPPRRPLSGPQDQQRLFECIVHVLESFCHSSDDKTLDEPLVLLLSDLQWASRETAELIDYLLDRLSARPFWVLTTSCTEDPFGEAPRHRRTVEELTPRTSSIVLERLDSGAIEEVAAALVDSEQSDELASFLAARSEGLPIAVAEWINLLWDEGVLVYDAGRWRLRESLTCRERRLSELVQQRLHRLPTSARRLAAQAVIMGQTFDAHLLQESADEHAKVVEVSLELMLERWLIRQHSEHWMSGRREHDMVLWAKGARRGHFEFNHRLIWQSIYEEVNPLRRQIMHGEIGTATESSLGEDAGQFCELLAFHFIRATAWDRAIVHLRRALRNAERLDAPDTARHYLRQAVEVLAKLKTTAPRSADRERWRQEHEDLNARLVALETQCPESG